MKGDCRDYLNRMTPDIVAGMAFTIGSRQPKAGDRWLVGDRCDNQPQCDIDANGITTYFSNLEFWTYGAQGHETQLGWRGMCGGTSKGACGEGCAECRYSYPADDPLKWDGEWSKCRCKDNNLYHYGNRCDLEDGDSNELCGANCVNCQKSWPADDPDRWNSPEQKCRCLPDQNYDITFGTHDCKNSNDGICGDDCATCLWSWPTGENNRSDRAMCRCADGQ